jgi:hypothetical protein
VAVMHAFLLSAKFQSGPSVDAALEADHCLVLKHGISESKCSEGVAC